MTHVVPLTPASAARLRALRTAELCNPGDPQLHERCTAYLAALHAAGYSCTALAQPMGLTRQRVHQRLKQAGNYAVSDLPLVEPPPPPPPPPPRAPRTPRRRHRPSPPGLPAEVVAELRAMHDAVRKVNGSTPLDDPRRRLSLQLSARLAELLDQGATATQLARALDITLTGLRARLGRHGHRPVSPSLRHNVYRGVVITPPRRT